MAQRLGRREAELPALAGPGEFELKSVSVFGDKAEGVLKAFMRSSRGNMIGALRDFMKGELLGRKRLAGKDDVDRWDDASNFVWSIFLELNMKDVRAGKDLRLARADLGETQDGHTQSDPKKVEALVKVYFAARKRVFPEMG